MMMMWLCRKKWLPGIDVRCFAQRKPHLFYREILGAELLSEYFLALLSVKLCLGHQQIPQKHAGKTHRLSHEAVIFEVSDFHTYESFDLAPSESRFLAVLCSRTMWWTHTGSICCQTLHMGAVSWKALHRGLMRARTHDIHKNDWNPAQPVFGNIGKNVRRSTRLSR